MILVHRFSQDTSGLIIGYWNSLTMQMYMLRLRCFVMAAV